MAAAAAGTGTWAAQEKQFPPALLSFFIYNPRFGPREGEVRRGGCARASAETGERPGTGGRLSAQGSGCGGRGAALILPALAEPLRAGWRSRWDVPGT